MTNFEKIKAMSVEQTAKYIYIKDDALCDEICISNCPCNNGEWVEGMLVRYNPELEVANMADEFEILVPVNTKTVGQFTGLTDKNGTKIFEGDIVSTDIKRPYLIVEFRDGCFMFNCNDGGEDYYDIMLPICKEPHKEYQYGEVIGNIHDNPELLKEREQ